MYAEVWAIGPFNQKLSDHYEYPAHRYALTRDRVPIVSKLFGIVEGTHTGTAFAQALGIADPWDFNQHKIDPQRINFDALRALLAPLDYAEDYLRDIDALQAFAVAGYDLYFLPGG